MKLNTDPTANDSQETLGEKIIKSNQKAYSLGGFGLEIGTFVRPVRVNSAILFPMQQVVLLSAAD